MTRNRWPILTTITALILAAASGCRPGDESTAPAAAGASISPPASAPTNRIAVPATVRKNLGITFARVESRAVSRTLRVPGRFELLPTARREYHAPLGGRTELFVSQFDRIEAGTLLYRIDSAQWRDLHERITAMQAKVDSMGPLRNAHRVHEQSLADKVALWKDRLQQLEELRISGGGSAAQFTEARATLNATQAELADVMEKDAALQAEQKAAEAELRSLQSRHDLLVSAAAAPHRHDGHAAGAGYDVHAIAPGVIEGIGVTPGGLIEENGLVVTIVQPELIRFRARGLQSDLGRLRDGLPAAIAPPQGGSIPVQDVMTGELKLGLSADADERTIDLIVTPGTLSTWARTGVAAHLEITLDGGESELAIPLAAVIRDGLIPVIFRRDPADPDKVIRLEADLGLDDGRWVIVASGVREGDEVVVSGNYQLMLATSGTAAEGGHFHSDGTFHEGED